jgi:hypothetical protein
MLTSRKNDNFVSFNLIREPSIQILKTYDLTSHLLSSQMVHINLEGGGPLERVCDVLCEIQCFSVGGNFAPIRDDWKCLEIFFVVTLGWKMLPPCSG